MLARFRELPVLVLDLLKKTNVLDRNHRLVGKGGDQLDLLLSERSHNRAEQEQDADRIPLSQKRDSKPGAIPAFALCDPAV